MQLLRFGFVFVPYAVWWRTHKLPYCGVMCCAGSKIHNESVAMARLSAEHHGSSRGLKHASGSMNTTHSLNSNNSHNSDSSLRPPANGSSGALPTPV